MLSAGFSTLMVGKWLSSTPTNSASLPWIPSVAVVTMKRISPFNSLAAFSKTLAKSESASPYFLKRKRAAFF